MQIADIESLCHDWQKRLRLQDWKITMQVCRHASLKDAYGECEYHAWKKEAVIKILDESDRLDTFAPPLEKTLIHELLHLHFAPFWNDPEEANMETAINQLADSFYRLKYSPHEKPTGPLKGNEL